jgi:hypothetical protein
MDISVDNIRLDLNRHKDKTAIYLRIGDTLARTVRCTLVLAGAVIPLDKAILASILIKKADGYEADNGVVIQGNELVYTWRTTDVSAEGENLCQFVVTMSDGAVISSPEFSVFAYKKEIDQKVEKSMNEYTAITQQVALAGKYAESAQTSEKTVLSCADNVKIMEAAASESAAAARESENKAKEYLTRFGEDGNLTLGETESTAYRGDRGKEAYEQSKENAETLSELKTYMETMINRANYPS